MGERKLIVTDLRATTSINNPSNVKLRADKFPLRGQIHVLDCEGSNTAQVQAAVNSKVIALVTVYRATGLVPNRSHVWWL